MFNRPPQSFAITVDRILHKAMDRYAFIAFTASIDTLEALTSMIQKDNDERQRLLNTRVINRRRYFDVDTLVSNSIWWQTILTFSLVHGRLFQVPHLPTRRSRSWALPSSMKTSVHLWRINLILEDLCCGLRSHITRKKRRFKSTTSKFFIFSTTRTCFINPFLVILNAEIKFRRYNRIQPALPALHPDVIELMEKTSALVTLL